jgi:hypothetical protein
MVTCAAPAKASPHTKDCTTCLTTANCQTCPYQPIAAAILEQHPDAAGLIIVRRQRVDSGVGQPPFNIITLPRTTWWLGSSIPTKEESVGLQEYAKLFTDASFPLLQQDHTRNLIALAALVRIDDDTGDIELIAGIAISWIGGYEELVLVYRYACTPEETEQDYRLYPHQLINELV